MGRAKAMGEVLRHRDFRLLFVAQALSMGGDWTLLLVFGIWAKTLTGSSATAGMTIFAMAAPALLTPLGGVVVDRVSRRQLIALTSLTSSVVVSCLWFVRGRDQLWILFAVAVYCGLISVVINAAVSALVQDMLPIKLVGTANSLLATVRQGLRLVGPLAGAGLFTAFGGGTVATVDALTFVGAAAAVARIRLTETAPTAKTVSLRVQVGAGLAHLRADRVLRRAALTQMIALTALGISEPAVFALVDAGLHRPPPFLSVLTSMQGAGAIAAGVTLTALIARLPAQTVLGASLIGLTLGVALEPLPWLAATLAGFALVGAALPALSVSVVTLLQQRTPNQVMGRVAIAVDVASSVPFTAMIAVGAALVGVVSFRLLFAVSALGCGVAALFARTISPSPAPTARGAVTRSSADQPADSSNAYP